MATQIRLVSWNVNGIRAAVNKDFYDNFKKLDADIFCIQETKAQDDIVEEIASKIEGYSLAVNSASKKGYSGTAVFSRITPLSTETDMGVKEHDEEGRLITLEFDGFYLVAGYIPNSGAGLKRLDYRKTWDADLKKYLKKLQDKKPVIFTGDLNVAHEPIDLARPKQNYNKSAGYTQTEIDGFDNFLSLGLVDTFRQLHPEKQQYSYWSMRFNGREKNVGWRLDYFLVSESLMKQVKDSVIRDDIFGSDHCPVELILNL